MKKFLVVAAATTSIALAGTPALAGDYGQAGCGLGGLVVKQNNWLQIFAATLNGISSNQLFAISTGTLGCDGASGGSESAKVFIETNREILAKDAARGQGETIVALSAISGCSDAAAVGASLQRNYQTVFADGQLTDREVSDRVVSAMQQDNALMCTGFSS